MHIHAPYMQDTGDTYGYIHICIRNVASESPSESPSEWINTIHTYMHDTYTYIYIYVQYIHIHSHTDIYMQPTNLQKIIK